MMSEKHPTGKHLPHPVKPVLFCSLIGTAAAALLLAGFSFLLTLQDLPHAAVEPLALLAGGFGCLLAGFLCARLYGRSGLLIGAACGVLVFGIIFLAGSMTMGGEMGPSLWLKGLIFLFCGAIGGVLGVNTVLPVK